MTTKRQGVKILPMFFIHIYLCDCTIRKRGRIFTPIKKNSTKNRAYFYAHRTILFCVIFNRVIIQFNYNVHI